MLSSTVRIKDTLPWRGHEGVWLEMGEYDTGKGVMYFQLVDLLAPFYENLPDYLTRSISAHLYWEVTIGLNLKMKWRPQEVEAL